MYVLKVSRWRKKLAVFLVLLLVVVGVGWGINYFLSPEDTTTGAPADNLERDVLTQPVEVQGQPAGMDMEDAADDIIEPVPVDK